MLYSHISSKHSQNVKIAYIHTMTYPSAEANAIQAITMASAFSRAADTTFFIPRLKTSISTLSQLYDISDAPLKIQPLYLDRFPSRFGNWYSQFASLYLRFHPKWALFRGNKVLFVRSPKELIFWGVQRERHKWLKDWIFIFEAHDVLGMDPNTFQGGNPFELQNGFEKEYHQALLKALINFDLIICVTQALTDDLRSWTNNTIQPHLVRHASSLPRASTPAPIHFQKKVVLGYVGTIDLYRGVNTLLEALQFLPHNYVLRLVGRIKQEKGVDPSWLNSYMNDPLISDRVELINQVPVHAVAEEIDRCDIVLQPASHDTIDSRYASPLKSFDYMARGKPIIVADVPCHRELFQDGENGIFYRVGKPQHLAGRITNLVSHPDLAARIAQTGWKQSVDYTYQYRAEKILSLTQVHHKEKRYSSDKIRGY
jgi:glycosyltransferase involved in cell wall biosynthesis